MSASPANEISTPDFGPGTLGPVPRDDAQTLWDPAKQAMGLQFADGLAHGGAVDAELAREVGLRGQCIAGPQHPIDDAPFDDVRNLAVCRMIVERLELRDRLGARRARCAAQIDSPKSTRPISILRISEVPAPISYSFASRSSLPVG